MNIRLATISDLDMLVKHDKHIKPNVLKASIQNGFVLLAFLKGEFIGWLRWNLFWDNTPFMNMLYFLEPYRRKGYGKTLVAYWEALLIKEKYNLLMTSSLADEQAQHFYRKLGYADSGSLFLEGEAVEIIFTKKI